MIRLFAGSNINHRTELRILIIALSGIGDALLFTPAALLLRTQFPDATIDALVMFRGVRDIYNRTGLFNNVIFHDFLNRPKSGSLRLVLRMRGKYDASINVYPSNRKEYNIIQYLIGAKKRGAVNYLRRDAAEFGFLNNASIVEKDSLHCVEENVALCEKVFRFSSARIPDLHFPLTDEDAAFAESFLESKSIGRDDLVVGMHAGTATFKNQVKRRWEPAKFAELSHRLAAEKGAKVLIFGGPDEAGLKEEIVGKAESDSVMAADTPGLPETAAVMKRCDLFVSNDSSLMHIAAAMKRKVVAVIGPTDTNYIHPWHTEYEIASLNLECSPCFIYSPRPLKCFRDDVKFKCIKELDVDLVYDKAVSLLGK